mmetsp:Transcript_22305/g.31873  ORF Transcript_22305/g.31873 Transcript_22305/m.31873 type:complete len:95 (-) Transcript_22305:78-362(-)
MQLPKSGSIVDMAAIPGSLFIPSLGIATIRNGCVELLDLHQHIHTVVCDLNINCQTEKEIERLDITHGSEKMRDALLRSTVDRGCVSFLVVLPY